MGKKSPDLTNKRFGSLTAKEKVKKGRYNYWMCFCDCGNTKLIRADHLTRGETTDCGCRAKRSARIVDRVGQRYGKLTVVDLAPTIGGAARWVCKCECGNYAIVSANHLSNGSTKSCGCMKHAVGRGKYGYAKNESPKLYGLWSTIKQRCENQNREKYSSYGGRGIKVCEEWKDPNAFIEWALNNGYQEGLQIDRINNDGDYSPQNCRWVTNKENCRNRRSNISLTVNGETKIAVEWCEEKRVSPFTVYSWVREKGKEYAERRLAEI